MIDKTISHYKVLEKLGEGCNFPKNRLAIQIRLSKELEDIGCPGCGKRVLLLDLFEENFASNEFPLRAPELDEWARVNLANENH